MSQTCPTILRNKTEFAACVPADVAQLFWARARALHGDNWVFGHQQNLIRGTGTLQSAYVFQLAPYVQTGQSGILQVQAGQAVAVVQHYEESTPRSLAEANWWYATELFSEAPESYVRQVAREIGVREDISHVDMRAGCAIITAWAATEAGNFIPQVIAQARDGAGAAGNFFDKFTSGLKKLFSDPGAWFQRVFITEPGKAVQWAGRQLVSLSANQWTKWLIDPLGIFLQLGSFLEQLGIAMVAGSITAFDERAFAIANAQHWRQVGAALAIVSPFLPPPWNIIGIAVGALFTAVGTAILVMYQQAEAGRTADEKKDAADARAAAAAAALAQAEADAAYLASLDGDQQGARMFTLDKGPLIVLASAALILLGLNHRGKA